IQHVVPEVTIPPEVTPENVVTHIVDSSARAENREQLETEIRKAHVICIVYSVDNQHTFNRLASYWLPYIRGLGVNVSKRGEKQKKVPVVLVGNKIDLRGDQVTNQSLEDEIIPIMNEFKVLKPACIDALKRIFNLCDTDKDGVLNDDELNEFQRKCFNAPLQQQELEGVKEVVKEHEPAGVNEVGFDVPHDCSVELSPNGYQFFTDIFQVFDKDKDGALKDSELEQLFSTTPANPWINSEFPHTTITNEAGAVTLQGWLAQWSMTTSLDYKTTLSYLAYLGFEGDTTTALKKTKPRKADRKRNKVQRNVFLAYVFGAAGSGKSSLLRAFVNKPFTDGYTPTSRSFSVVNSVEIKGAEKYLVLQEFGSKYEAEILQNKRKLEACDLICFVYDSSDTNSFSYIAELRRHEVQPDVYCRNLGLAVPLSVSVKNQQTADLWNLLTGVSINPAIATPGLADSAHGVSRIKKYLTFTAVMGAIMGAAFMGYRLFQQQRG
ncbi:13079_t:CDS:10, partial [Acaulospora colombiana]